MDCLQFRNGKAVAMDRALLLCHAPRNAGDALNLLRALRYGCKQSRDNIDVK